jgi:hypothetical protein
MVIWTAYYDTAGRDDEADSLVVTGLISTEQKWTRFERAWNVALARQGLTYLHMADFVARQKPFDRLSDPQRLDLLKELIPAIKRNVNKWVSRRLCICDFEAVDRVNRLSEVLGSAFQVCALRCVLDVQDWIIINKKPARSPQHILEAGERHLGALIDFCKEIKVDAAPHPKTDPISGEWLPELQAADFIAWESRRGLADLEGGRAFRGSFEALMRQVPQDIKAFDRAGLQGICKVFPKILGPRKEPKPKRRTRKRS